MLRRVAILGSTGSIGRQALEVADALIDRVEVIGLAAGNNADLLLSQVERFRPRFVSCVAPLPKATVSSLGAEIVTMEEMAALPEADEVVVATVGRAGLIPSLAAIDAGKMVAIANKEVLVMAGELVVSRAKRSAATILPVDSEHSAIWQCLRGEGDGRGMGGDSVRQLTLTASGGPLVDLDKAALQHVKPAQALRHPTWQMGPKITIDSATLMNKGLEIIEARWFFDIDFSKIDVLLHRESIVHSLVEFVDGSIKAQLGPPDMRLPIQYALTFPKRAPSAWPRLDLANLGRLSFDNVDETRFPCLRLAKQAGVAGGTYPAVLTAADEVAVEAFLAGEIEFGDISVIVERAIDAHDNVSHPSLDDILEVDARVRESCRKMLVRAI